MNVQHPRSAGAKQNAAAYFLEVLTALPIPLTTALYSISFAVIVYSASLASHMDIGISLALVGSGAAVIITALVGSLRGTISHAQDATAVLLAGAISPMVAGLAATHGEDARFATALVFVAVCSFLTGIIIFLAGHYRLGYVARFMPYPVISGLLVSIGYLLSVGSVGLVLHQNVSILQLPALFAEGALWRWMPWAAGATLMIMAGHFISPSRVLPLGLFLGICIFFGSIAWNDVSLAQAAELGLLLGPFPSENRLHELSIAFLAQADWTSVFQGLPTVLALIPMAAVSGILNLQGIAQATGSHHDLDADVKAMGLSNLASGLAGGLICYPAVSTTLLGRHLKVPIMLMLVLTSIICVAFGIFGTAVLGNLPRGLFAMIVLYLGLGLLLETIVNDARRLPFRDFVLVLVILTTTAFFGVFPALIVGIIFSMGIFIVSYARLPFLRSDTSLATRRSIVERSEGNRSILNEEGKRVRVMELTGSLFFGSAFALRRHIIAVTEADQSQINTIIVDFRSVRDVDTSALFSLERTLVHCERNGIEVCFCGLRKIITDRLKRFASTQKPSEFSEPRIFATLDEALQTIETELLENHADLTRASGDSFEAELATAHPDSALSDVFPIVAVRDGETIVRQGATSQEIYVLLDGKAVATVKSAEGDVIVVARFEPGAMIGEIAFYLNSPRTATVTADGDARLIQVDLSSLETNGRIPEGLISQFHLTAAKYLAQRLAATTKQLQSAQR